MEVFGQALSKQLETLSVSAKAVAGKLPKSRGRPEVHSAEICQYIRGQRYNDV